MKATNETISVIIPIYKVEQYLERCIISVIHQTYHDLEIILVDDGSPDRCPAICDKWAERDPRIRVIHKENGGLSDARNMGLRYATGQWVLFVDSDDWISLNMAEGMLQIMKKCDADMVICRYVLAWLDGNMRRSFCCAERVKVLNRREMFERLLEDKEITNHVPIRLFKRNLISPDVFPQGKNYEDIAAMPFLSELCEKIVLLDEAYYFYMTNPKGITCSKTGKNVLDCYEAEERAYAKIEELHPDLKKNIENAKITKALYIWKDMLEIQDGSGKNVRRIKSELRHWLKGRQSALTEVLESKNIPFYYAMLSRIPLLDRFIWFCFYVDSSPVKRILKKLRTIIQARDVRFESELKKKADSRFMVFCILAHGNLGDRAMEVGEQLFISKYFPEYKYCGIPLDYTMRVIRHRRKYIRKGDLVAIHAGGDMGTSKSDFCRMQEYVIKKLKRRGLCIFPQTYDYSVDGRGSKDPAAYPKFYDTCRNLGIFVRENGSYRFAKENIPSGDVKLMPDMALMLPEFVVEKVERKGAMTCLCCGLGKVIGADDLDQILGYLEERFGYVLQSDTDTYRDSLSQEEAEQELDALLARMASVEIVLTDRLHGMIFAALTKTPCLVIPDKSHQIEDVYGWIRENPYIRLLHCIEDLPVLAEVVIHADCSRLERSRVQEQFARMAEMIRSQQEKF